MHTTRPSSLPAATTPTPNKFNTTETFLSSVSRHEWLRLRMCAATLLLGIFAFACAPRLAAEWEDTLFGRRWVERNSATPTPTPSPSANNPPVSPTPLAPPAAPNSASAGTSRISPVNTSSGDSIGLRGFFYDIKQSPSGVFRDPGYTGYVSAKILFINGGWNSASLSQYYRAPEELRLTHVLIPARSNNAHEAPRNFHVEDKVKPMRWMVHYRGIVKAPFTGRFRFVGVADDWITVRWNTQNVLDSGYRNVIVVDDEAVRNVTDEYESVPRTPPMRCSPWLEVKEGSQYPLEIALGEEPGGEFYAYLAFEKATDKGNLHLFRMAGGKLPEALTNGSMGEIPKNINLSGGDVIWTPVAAAARPVSTPTPPPVIAAKPPSLAQHVLAGTKWICHIGSVDLGKVEFSANGAFIHTIGSQDCSGTWGIVDARTLWKDNGSRNLFILSRDGKTLEERWENDGRRRWYRDIPLSALAKHPLAGTTWKFVNEDGSIGKTVFYANGTHDHNDGRGSIFSAAPWRIWNEKAVWGKHGDIKIEFTLSDDRTTLLQTWEDHLDWGMRGKRLWHRDTLPSVKTSSANKSTGNPSSDSSGATLVAEFATLNKARSDLIVTNMTEVNRRDKAALESLKKQIGVNDIDFLKEIQNALTAVEAGGEFEAQEPTAQNKLSSYRRAFWNIKTTRDKAIANVGRNANLRVKPAYDALLRRAIAADMIDLAKQIKDKKDEFEPLNFEALLCTGSWQASWEKDHRYIFKKDGSFIKRSIYWRKDFPKGKWRTVRTGGNVGIQFTETIWPGTTHFLSQDRKKMVNPQDGGALLREE